jgi:hypothetical protein
MSAVAAAAFAALVARVAQLCQSGWSAASCYASGLVLMLLCQASAVLWHLMGGGCGVLCSVLSVRRVCCTCICIWSEKSRQVGSS